MELALLFVLNYSLVSFFYKVPYLFAETIIYKGGGFLIFMEPVSRAYHKLKYGLDYWKFGLEEEVCADFGSSTGGFVQAILEKPCSKVYSVETSKNRLHFVLKDDSRVVVLDNTNAIHVELPEKVDFISIDGAFIQK